MNDTGKSLLLHACCAPCFAYVHEIESVRYEVTSFFFNPNIAPAAEYERRRGELEAYARSRNIPLLIEDPDIRSWVREVKPHRFDGERSERCRRCYRFRLERAFCRGKELAFDAVGTVLSISPHKDADALNRIGRELEKEYGIAFINADYKKNNGFLMSVERSKEHGFYRQDYCGCVYSRLEKKKNSLWYRNARSVAGKAVGIPQKNATVFPGSSVPAADSV